MLKFVKHTMESIAGVEIYPLISLLIFFTFFVGLLVYVFKMKKTDVAYLSEIPMHSGVESETESRKA